MLLERRQIEGLRFVADNEVRVEELGKEPDESTIAVEEDDSDVEDEADASPEAGVESTMIACLQ